MFRAFVIGFLRNEPPPPPLQEIDFQGVSVRVTYLQFKKKQGMQVSVLGLPIYSLKKTRNADFWLFLDNIITDKEDTKPNSFSDS